MTNRTTRDLTHSEKAFIADVLGRLREHFHQWKSSFEKGDEHDLVAFAFYEGCGDSDCCGEILAESAPFALGQELVTRHGFRWIMLSVEATARYGVMHPALGEPIDLHSLEGGSWNDEDARARPSQGERTHESLATILKRVGQRSE